MTGSAVVKPVADGLSTLLTTALVVLGVLLLALVGLAYKHGPPSLELVKTTFSLFKK